MSDLFSPVCESIRWMITRTPQDVKAPLWIGTRYYSARVSLTNVNLDVAASARPEVTLFKLSWEPGLGFPPLRCTGVRGKGGAWLSSGCESKYGGPAVLAFFLVSLQK